MIINIYVCHKRLFRRILIACLRFTSNISPCLTLTIFVPVLAAGRVLDVPAVSGFMADEPRKLHRQERLDYRFQADI